MRPNIIVILADDMGYGDMACNNPDSKIPTPHLDRLAASGMRFTDAHAPCAVCTPTRYGLLTGRYAWRSRLKAGVLWTWDPPLIEEGRLTMPEMLRGEGYRTACIGKWHLGWNWPTTDGEEAAKDGSNVDWEAPIEGGPLAHGFDTYFGDDVPNFPPYVFIENDRTLGTPSIPKPRTIYGHDGPMKPGWKLERVLPEITRQAVRYIEDSTGEEEPFFLYFPLTAPHTPIAPAKRFRGKSGAGLYGDFVAEVDTMVGQVIAALERTGQRENTLVIFASDNGSPARDGTNMSGAVRSVERYGHIPNAPFRGIKADVWDGGHRGPFIASWPASVLAGSVTPATVCHVDLMRTFAGLAGAEVPEDAAVDSFDILPVLRGEELEGLSRAPVVHHSGNGRFAIRDGRWKLVLCPGSGGWSGSGPPDAPPVQLYDMKRDPEEAYNLYHERPDKVEELTAALATVVENGRSTPGPPQPQVEPINWQPKVTEAKDETGRFDVVRNCAVTNHPEGFVLESSGIGFAVERVEPGEELTRSYSFESLAEGGSRNALLVFGEEPEFEELVKCGTLIVAGKHAIWRGGWEGYDKGVTVEHSLAHTERTEVRVSIDAAKRRVRMEVGGETLEADIPKAVREVRYVGWLVNGTRTLIAEGTE